MSFLESLGYILENPAQVLTSPRQPRSGTTSETSTSTGSDMIDAKHQAWRNDCAVGYVYDIENRSIHLQEIVKAGAILPEMAKNDLKLTIERLREIVDA